MLNNKTRWYIIIIVTTLLIFVSLLFFPVSYMSPPSQEFSELTFTRKQIEDSYEYTTYFNVTNLSKETKIYNNIHIEFINLKNGNSQVTDIETFLLEQKNNKKIQISYESHFKYDHIKLFTVNEFEIRNYISSFTIDESEWFQDWGCYLLFTLICLIFIIFIILYWKKGKDVFFVMYLISLAFCLIYLLICYKIFDIDVNIISIILTLISSLIFPIVQNKKIKPQ